MTPWHSVPRCPAAGRRTAPGLQAAVKVVAAVVSAGMARDTGALEAVEGLARAGVGMGAGAERALAGLAE